jgi:hypothetical protein
MIDPDLHAPALVVDCTSGEATQVHLTPEEMAARTTATDSAMQVQADAEARHQTLMAQVREASAGNPGFAALAELLGVPTN